MYRPVAHFEEIDDHLEFSLKTKMGCLILAGGQASRLGIDAPKGTFPITRIRQKSLFQYLLEKAKAASVRESYPLPIAIMTSPLNHEATVNFLERHHYFGYPEEHIFFFQQSMRPLEDKEGHTLSLSGPDGNGYALSLFYTSGIWHAWKERGITTLHVIPVDNPLADPFDSHVDPQGAEVVIQAILRNSSEEQVGVLVQEGERIKVIEYTELSPSLQKQSHLFTLANSGLFFFSMPFIEKIHAHPLPLHRQNKTISWAGEIKDIYKYESFIFDLLPFSVNTRVLVYPRAMTFSPLKTLTHLSDVQAALLERDRRQFYLLSGLPVSNRIFELDPAFYYPTQKLLDKWKGKELPDNSYIDP